MTFIASCRPTDSPTLNDLLRVRAEENPDKIRFAFLGDGETITAALTYSELYHRARAVAAFLQNAGARGERAILLYPPGIDFIAAFFGCFLAGVIAIPCCPPPNLFRLSRSLNRFRAIARDARPLLALTTSFMLTRSQQIFSNAPDLLAMRWIPTNEVGGEWADGWHDPNVAARDLAFLQYTSGSTAAPKGVMISHENILYNAGYIAHQFQHTPESVAVTWMPTFHDLGLMDAMFQPLYSGFESYLMSPLEFLQRPIQWLRAITALKATYSSGPNFAFDFCAERVSLEQRQTLDLSNWRAAVIAAEPVQKRTIERFIKVFEPAGFRPTTFTPCYGLAEATLKVSGADVGVRPVYRTIRASDLEQNKFVEVTEQEASKREVRTLVSCGSASNGLHRVKVVIVDPDTLTRCAPDRIGEIWVSSPSVALGYWNRPKETSEVFHSHLADTGEGPFLRTGDLGLIRDGELFITGRLKDVIIIDGRNHYPQDIERTTVESHAALHGTTSAAFSIDVDGYESLVIVAEVSRAYRPLEENSTGEEPSHPEPLCRVTRKELVRSIRRAIAEEHDINVHAVLLLRTGGVPKTSSGKIQHSACRQAFLEGTLAESSW